MAAACLHGLALTGIAQDKEKFRLAAFSTEVTPPLGHACMGGGIAPVQKIEDPLFIHGLVLLGDEKPIVIAAIDWCEIRNDAYDRWRTVLAEAARTTPERVLFSSVHQHDTPIADLTAQRLLEKHQAKGSICDLEFHEKTVQRVAKALRDCLAAARPVTHLGIGQAKVAEVASNRRFVTADGKPQYGRMSATRDPKLREYPEGTIDPWLKTLSFWEDEKPAAILSAYATHPMSYYGKGAVTADFVGQARKRFQADHPQAAVLYISGCSGNVTAGKYNDGAPENRPVLADKIYQAMTAAWTATKKQPLRQVAFRSTKLRLEPRNDPGFTVADLTKRLTTDPKPFGQCLAALGLSWRQRAEAGFQLDVPVVDFGPAQYLLLPAEADVEFQLHAQQMRPDGFVMTAGYGECAPGYIPTERTVEEKDSNLHDWCWVAPGADKAMRTAIETVLKPVGK
ncbi:MAG: hypothetical protein JNM56_04120 [Planctomycetia bacterium]|nr:hypothetical protein [Planctomycetia bacterium]